MILVPYSLAARQVPYIMLVVEVGQGFQKIFSCHTVAADPVELPVYCGGHGPAECLLQDIDPGFQLFIGCQPEENP
jgi:hypothetical protein